MTVSLQLARNASASKRVVLVMREVFRAFHQFNRIDRIAGYCERICFIIGASRRSYPADDACQCEQSSNPQRNDGAHLSLLARLRVLLVSLLSHRPSASRMYAGNPLSSAVQNLNCSELHDRRCGQIQLLLQNDFAARTGEWACDQIHTITAKTGYHSVDQRLKPMARFPMNVAIGKRKIRSCARLGDCYVAALVPRTAANAGDRVCQRRVTGPVGDRSRAFSRP